jgi:DNA-binding NarL/FixJ family response regulator
MKCLIIEDSPSELAFFMELVRSSWKIEEVPLEIVGCATLAEGLIEAADANVTVLDLNLQDSAPEHTIKALRSFPPPVIVLTGDESPETVRSCLVNGADHVFFKRHAIGFIPAIFEMMQKDILRRASERKHEPKDEQPIG